MTISVSWRGLYTSAGLWGGLFVLALLGFSALLYEASPAHEGWRVRFALDPGRIVAGDGKAFVYRLDRERLPQATFCEDTNEQPHCSGLELFEDGRRLGPAHSLHADLGRMGGGRFSHWAGHLFFSTSDGSDPRANGRRYEIAVPFRLKPEASFALTLSFAALAAVAAWFGRSSLFGLGVWLRAPWTRESAVHQSRPAYRPDIDGLRAVSVISVMLVHIGAPAITGGFTGVDIFFVISGYLITGILWSELSRGPFTFAGFYARRLRRIAPALLIVLLATLIAGVVLLTPDMYATVARSTVAAALGLGNVFFYLNSGYFDAASIAQPLLHTWSLGVEEQFYLVWPLLLGAAAVYSRHSRMFVVIVLCGLMAGSFAASVHYLETNAKWAFYGPVTRAWELALGALLVFIPASRLPGRWVAEALSLAGAGLILWSLFALNAGDRFPGPNALFACVGAALLILPQRQPTLVARALSVRPMVVIGLLSYSLYLWHWPILVLARHYNNMAPLGFQEAGMLIALSLALSWLTWRHVERPFRRGGKVSAGRVVVAGLAAIGATCAVALFVSGREGFPSRLPVDARKHYDLAEMWRWPCPAEAVIDGTSYCAFGAPWETSRQRAILYGDSKAEHLAPLLEYVVRDSGVSVLMVNNCPAAFGGRVYRGNLSAHRQLCASHRDNLLSLLRSEKPTRVMFAASWAFLSTLHSERDESGDCMLGATTRRGAQSCGPVLADGLEEIMPALAQNHVQVWLLGDTPNMFLDPASCAVGAQTWLWRRSCSPDSSPTALYKAYNQQADSQLRSVAAHWPNARFFSPGAQLCQQDGHCLTRLNGEPLYRDAVHFRRNLTPGTLQDLARRMRLADIFSEPDEAGAPPRQ